MEKINQLITLIKERDALQDQLHRLEKMKGRASDNDLLCEAVEFKTDYGRNAMVTKYMNEETVVYLVDVAHSALSTKLDSINVIIRRAEEVLGGVQYD